MVEFIPAFLKSLIVEFSLAFLAPIPGKFIFLELKLSYVAFMLAMEIELILDDGCYRVIGGPRAGLTRVGLSGSSSMPDKMLYSFIIYRAVLTFCVFLEVTLFSILLDIYLD